jgi:prolyl-tRNA synthetase
MDGLVSSIQQVLDDIQRAMLDKAREFRDSHTTRTTSYDEFKQIMEGRPGFVISPWCESGECEAQIKTDTQATIRNMPFGQDEPTGSCIRCDRPAAVFAWFAKAY